MAAVKAIDIVLGWVRAGRQTSSAFQPIAAHLWKVLRKYKDEPVSAAVGALHDAADREVLNVFNEISVPANSSQITVPVLDVPELTAAFEQEARDSGLLVLHRQFWLPPSAVA